MIATHAVKTACPACRDTTATVFHEQRDVPVTSNRVFRSREEAQACPRGEIRLAFCHACGFISNVAYDSRFRYEDSETSQGGSPKFREYTTALARKWVRRHGLRSKAVLEIGAGRGEFLQAMVGQGVGRAIGVDPSLASGAVVPPSDRFTWIAEDFRAAHVTEDVSAIICRHTLEHVPDTAEFLGGLRDSIGDRDLPVLFEVPDVLPILRKGAFHDVYYEHCSYFTAGSVARAFATAGFTVDEVGHAYGGQYLLIEARPASGRAHANVPDDRPHVWLATSAFEIEASHRVEAARSMLDGWARRGSRVAFWGAGSKATAYLAALEPADQVCCVVDVNPRKHGTYIPGTGHPVVAPEDLATVTPDVIVVMNEIYMDEVREMLRVLHLEPELVGVSGHD